MEVLLVLLPFVLLGAIAVLFVAFSGGPGKAREAYLTRGGRAFKVRCRCSTWCSASGVPAAVIAGDAARPRAAPARSQTEKLSTQDGAAASSCSASTAPAATTSTRSTPAASPAPTSTTSARSHAAAS